MRRFISGLSLKQRMMAVSMLAFGLVFAIITVMFVSTTSSVSRKTLESLNYLADEIDGNIESVLLNMQITSELLADDPRIIEYLERSYSNLGEESHKLRAMYDIRNNIFSSLNRTYGITFLSAIYSLQTGELFNFMDANRMDEETIVALEEILKADTKKEDGFTLVRYYWHPLQENFLNEPTGNVRQDKVMVGSRWIYDTARWVYSYVHVFALPERELYQCYASLAQQNNSEVYILNGRGDLLSSTNINAVEAQSVDEGLVNAVLTRSSDSFSTKIDGKKHFVKVTQKNLNHQNDPESKWLTVLLVPRASVMQDVKYMYLVFALVLAFCIAISAALLIYLYRQFMNPISDLNAAMIRVDSGDLNAYVDWQENSSEASQMIARYNRMLRGINRTLEEQMALEQEKKTLDMQVLTNQINPHFLYNTLETIVWKAGQAGRPDIGKIASSLGKLYRLSISGGKLFVPLGQELEHVSNYIEIQQSRYEGKFTYEVKPFDESLRDVVVPKIILQPVVENIFLYAIPEAERPVNIRVTIKKAGDLVKIKVLDDGPGMDKQRLAEVRRQIETGIAAEKPKHTKRRSTGIGLHNIKARLAVYLAQADGLHIYSKSSFGTFVVITVPIMPPHALFEQE